MVLYKYDPHWKVIRRKPYQQPHHTTSEVCKTESTQTSGIFRKSATNNGERVLNVKGQVHLSNMLHVPPYSSSCPPSPNTPLPVTAGGHSLPAPAVTLKKKNAQLCGTPPIIHSQIPGRRTCSFNGLQGHWWAMTCPPAFKLKPKKLHVCRSLHCTLYSWSTDRGCNAFQALQEKNKCKTFLAKKYMHLLLFL